MKAHDNEPTSQPVPLEQLSSETLKEVCSLAGPVISILIPARHPGDPQSESAAAVARLADQAEAKLQEHRYLGDAGRLLEPLRELAKQEAGRGGTARALYLNRAGLRQFHLAAPVAPTVVAGTFPLVTPILAELPLAPEYFVLALAKGRLRLGRCAQGHCAEVELPPAIAASFEETLASSRPDHDLQNHATAGAGHTGSVRFGTSTQRESVDARFHQFLRQGDTELARLRHGAPLVVVGIERELAAYRQAASSAPVLFARHTSPEHLSWTELTAASQAALLDDWKLQGERAAAEFANYSDGARIATGLRDILAAAKEGRIHQLLLERTARQEGLLGPLFPMGDDVLEGDHDLVNAAVVSALRTGAQVHVVEDGRLGPERVGAILRYVSPA